MASMASSTCRPVATTSGRGRTAVLAPLAARRPFIVGAAGARRGSVLRRAPSAELCARSVPQHRVCFFGFGGNDDDDEDEDMTVAKLQVGLFGKVDELQRELDRVASLMDTESDSAMQELVQDLVILLSRNLQYASYASSALFMTPDFDEAEAKFQEVAMKERLVFEKETLSNVGGRINRGRLDKAGADVGLDKWLCVTLLVAVERPLKLPKVRALEDLKKCLSLLGGCTVEDVVAVELLWTPQEEGDSYSKDEMLLDYPGLATL